jgi:hypothetical protein
LPKNSYAVACVRLNSVSQKGGVLSGHVGDLFTHLWSVTYAFFVFFFFFFPAQNVGHALIHPHMDRK